MIVQCCSCRALIDVSSVVLDARGAPSRAGIRCPECGEVSWLEVEQGTAPTPQPGAVTTSDSAPSSGAALPKPAAAPLAPEPPAPARDGFPVEACRARLAGLPALSDEAAFIAEGFEQLLLSWDDAAQHRKLVQRASLQGQLPALGVRYRTALEVRPGDPMAQRAQQEILALAMASLGPAAANDTTRGALKRVLTLAAPLIGFALLVWYIFQAFTPNG